MPNKLRNPVDFTSHGACSKCGACCAPILPVTDEELRTMRAEARRQNLRPAPLPLSGSPSPFTAYMRCPFLSPETDQCLIYEKRPAVCRAFSCTNNNEQNAVAYAAYTRATTAPPTRNIWLLFNQTGILLGDKSIPYDTADSAVLMGNDRKPIKIRQGRQATIHVQHPLMREAHVYPHALILFFQEEKMTVYDQIDNKAMDIPYAHITDIFVPEGQEPRL